MQSLGAKLYKYNPMKKVIGVGLIALLSCSAFAQAPTLFESFPSP